MSWKTPPDGGSAPGAGSDHDARLPGVDERLVQPEMRSEYVEGIEIFAAPANPPHAMDHARLAYVLGSVVKTSCRYAVDMLTRTTELSDFAPDASVFSMGDGGSERKLEELAFEVADEQPIGVPTNKARLLARRGVRRIFCILVKSRRVLESWSGTTRRTRGATSRTLRRSTIHASRHPSKWALCSMRCGPTRTFPARCSRASPSRSKKRSTGSEPKVMPKR